MADYSIFAFVCGFLRLLVQVGLLAASAHLIARRLVDEEDEWPDRCVVELTAFLFLMTATMILAGAFGLLNRPVLYGVWAGLAIVLHFVFRGSEPLRRSNASTVGPTAYQYAIGVSVGVFFVWKATISLPRFPGDYDTLCFHLPSAVEWIQRGNLLEALPGPFSYAPYQYASGGLLNVFLLMATGCLAPTHSTPLFFAAGIVILFAALLRDRRTGGPSWIAGLVILAWIGMPHLEQHHFESARQDLTLTFFWGLSLYFLLRLLRMPSVRRGLPFLAASGLLWGSKHSGFFYMGLIVFFAFLFLAPSLFRVRGLQRRWVTVVAAAILCCLPGWFWAFRNILLEGNPLYPGSFSIPGVMVREGVFKSKWLAETTIFSGFGDKGFLPLLGLQKAFAHQAGPVGYLVPGLLLVTPLVLLGGIWVRNREKHRRIPLLGLLFLGSTLLYTTTPFTLRVWSPDDFTTMSSSIRFALPAVLIGLVLWGSLFDPGKRFHQILLIVLFVGLFAMCWKIALAVLPWLAVFVVAFAVFLAPERRGYRMQFSRRSLAFAVLPFVAAWAGVIDYGWHVNWDLSSRKHFGALGAFFSGMDPSERHTILQSGAPVLLPLYGERYVNRVISYPADLKRWCADNLPASSAFESPEDFSDADVRAYLGAARPDFTMIFWKSEGKNPFVSQLERVLRDPTVGYTLRIHGPKCKLCDSECQVYSVAETSTGTP